MKTAVALRGIPETMLLTLHSRALESKRADGILQDAEAIRIYDSLDYDFRKKFGRRFEGPAARAVVFDDILKEWIAAHPRGTIVSLGEGLETQNRRVDNGKIRWLTVDLPESIAIREEFISPTDRFRHVAKSALDYSWMDGVDASQGVFIVAQGLLMYLPTDEVRKLLAAIARRFAQAEMLFDFVPHWLSDRTRVGLKMSGDYQLPEMPWALDRNEVKKTLREWLPTLTYLKLYSVDIYVRGPLYFLNRAVRYLTFVRNKLMGIAHFKL